MRTQKRDRVERCFLQGYKAGLHGHGSEYCHFQDVEMRGAWFNGWRQGRTTLITGFRSEPIHS